VAWNKLKPWIPAIAWTVLIFGLSSVSVFASTIIKVKMVDKLAHAAEYGGLGLFLTVGFVGTLSGTKRRWVTFLAILAGVAIGALDEIYQFTVPGRCSDFRDWIADSVGVVIGNRIAVGFYRWRAGER